MGARKGGETCTLVGSNTNRTLERVMRSIDNNMRGSECSRVVSDDEIKRLWNMGWSLVF